MDLIDDPIPGANDPEFSVSEISGAIKRMIEGEFSHVRIRGEVGRVSRPRSGHVYMDLKDDRSVLSGVIWKGVMSRLAVQPEEGMEVVATGRLTTFPGQSKYQIVIEDLKPAGVGALMAMLEKRKAKLGAEGLFAPERKQDLPFLPDVIGVVTSPSGAVIRDILHRLRDRFPRKVLIWPVAVQGERCASEVTKAIRGFNALSPGGAVPRPDLLIVARGGGSIEDLWGFNEESVVRAAAESAIPLISAVGHETDTTLIDYAADRRAPTPSAAAEMAVPVRLDLLSWLDGQGARLSRALTQGVSLRGQRLRDVSRALPRPETLLEAPRQRLDTWSDRLPQALTRVVQTRRVRLSEVSGALRPTILRRAVAEEGRRLDERARLLGPSLLRVVERRREALARRADRLTLRPILADIDRKNADLNNLSRRLSDAGQRQIHGWKEQIAGLDRLRETLGYKATLARGYVVVRAEGVVVTTCDAAKSAGALEIEFSDGRLPVRAMEASGDGTSPAGGGRAPKQPRKSGGNPPEQGSLF